jgi:hypothetical protein
MTAQGRGLRAAVTMALMATVAGCGGGGAGADETRAELRRWASAVDDVCRATHERIVARGDARDLREVHRVAVRASDDVRAGIERIRRVPISEEARPRVRSFLGGLAKIEPRLSEMTRTTVDGSLEEIGRLGLRLADETRLFQDRAHAVGLRECADARQFDAVLDAFTAPVYATQIARLEVWLTSSLRPLVGYVPSTPADFVRQLNRVGGVFQQAEKRLEDLYVYRPNRAVKADDDLHFALDAYETFLHDVADALDGGRRVLTPLGVRRFKRGVAKRQREVRQTFDELRAAIGARPFAVPGVQPPPRGAEKDVS